MKVAFAFLLIVATVLADPVCFVVKTTDDTTAEVCVDGDSIETTPSDADTVFATPADTRVDGLTTDVDTMWLILAGALVFFMQTGFGMLEAGVVQKKNVINILYKNVMDASVAAIVFAACGYGFAYGKPGAIENGFIGEGNFFLMDDTDDGTGFHNFFFQWTFSAAAATIVAGSVAERCALPAYFAYSVVLTGFIYPVVVHWVWSSNGWASAFNPEGALTKQFGGGMVDFAGSGVVHMTGGFAGLVAAIILGPRKGRFEGDQPAAPQPHNHTLASLGVLILWFGWYGFNCGSTLMISDGASIVASRVATTTTLSAAGGAVSGAFIGKAVYGSYDIMFALNGILAGLVSITSACAIVNPWSAVLIGILGAMVYKASSNLLNKLKIDDPLEAFPVHGCCGMWGVLVVGIFGTDDNMVTAAFANNADVDMIKSGNQFAVQLISLLAIIAWVVTTVGILFMCIKFSPIPLRVDDETEEMGLDISEHGAKAYDDGESADDVPLRPVGTDSTPSVAV